ncbi:MAG: hypothetical protein RIG61_12815 [Deltaproteobacteria bacterium]
MKAKSLASKWLRGSNVRTPINLFQFQRKAFYSSYNLVRVFYAIALYLPVSRLDVWSQWSNAKYISPLWPVYWINLTGVRTGVIIIVTFSVVSALLCLLFSHKRVFRIIWFIAVLNYVGFNFSFGKIDHYYHVVLAFSFIFIFLPDGKKEFIENSRILMQRYLTIFWGALLLFMTFYSMSGMWKIVAGIAQLVSGETSIFHSSAFALHVAHKILQLNSETILGAFFIKHELLGWFFFISAIYIELFSVIAIFRYSLHRIWGLFLILLHIGIYLAMEIDFAINVLFLAVFLCNSPFIPPGNKLGEALKDLPLVAIILTTLNPKRTKAE